MTEEDKNKWREVLNKADKKQKDFNKSYSEHLKKIDIFSKKNLDIFHNEIKNLNEVLKDFHLSFGAPITHNQTTINLMAMLGVSEEKIKDQQNSPIYSATSSLSNMYDSKGKIESDNIRILAFLFNKEISYQCVGDFMPKDEINGKSKITDEYEDKTYKNFKELVDDFLEHYKGHIVIHKEYVENKDKK